MVLFDEDENKEKYDSSDELHVAVHSQQFIYIAYSQWNLKQWWDIKQWGQASLHKLISQAQQ